MKSLGRGSRFSFIFIFLISIFTTPWVQAKTVHLAVIGGGTPDSNSWTHVDEAKLFFEMVRARGRNPLFAFSSGPRSTLNEGRALSATDFYMQTYGSTAELMNFLPSQKFVSFPKDFDGDSRIDVQFAGTRSDIQKAIQRSVSEMRDGDELYIQIGAHGYQSPSIDQNEFSGIAGIFQKDNGLYPYKAKNSNEANISYTEFFQWVRTEISRRRLSNTSVRFNAQTCYGGGTLLETSPYTCGVSAQTGNKISYGFSNPFFLKPPPAPLENLQLYEEAGYLYFYNKFLSENAEASMKQAYWHAILRDLINTPISSAEYSMKNFFLRTQTETDFLYAFEILHEQKKDDYEFEPPQLEHVPATSESLSALLAQLKSISEMPEARKRLFQSYVDIWTSEESIQILNSFAMSEAKLLQTLHSLGTLTKDQFGLDLISFLEMNRIQKSETMVSVFQMPFPEVFNNPHYKVFRTQMNTIGHVVRQIKRIQVHREQYLERIRLYVDFFMNANDQEFADFTQADMCLSKAI